MLDLTVKVVGKEITSASKGSFTVYSLLSKEGNWYRTAKIDTDELKKVKGEVMTVSVSRKFDREVVIEGEVRKYPTLVIESIRKPTEKELNEYNKRLDEINAQTLVGVK